MRAGFVVGVLAISLSLPYAPTAQAEDADTAATGTVKYELRGDLRARFERLENYFDFNDDGQLDTDFDGAPDSGDDFTFVPYRARVGVRALLPRDVEVVLDIQNFGAWGNQFPAQSFHFPPVQNFDGAGGTSGSRTAETSLYQGYLKLNKMWGSDFNLTIGRQEYEFGTGLILGNEDYYNGTVFDGIKGVWDAERWSVTGFAFINAERNDFSTLSFTGFASDDTNLAGAVGAIEIGGRLASKVEAYGVYYKDGFEGNFKPGWYTLGGHWWRSAAASREDVDSNHWDWNLEIAAQTGSITPRLCAGGLNPGDICTSDADCLGGGICIVSHDNLAGNLVDASLGFTLATKGDHLLRFHIGGLRQSGDDDLTDNDLDGWNSLFLGPTAGSETRISSGTTSRGRRC